MGHLRLVHSISSASALAHPCLDAFQGELDYLHQTLRRLGAAPHEIEDLAHEVFLALHRSWTTYDASRPLRPFLFGVAFQIVGGERGRLAREIPGGIFKGRRRIVGPRRTPQLMAALLEAGRIVPRQPDEVRVRAIVRARAALAMGEAFATKPRNRHGVPILRLAVIACLAFVVGATGAAVALRGGGRPPDPVNAVPSAAASEPSTKGGNPLPAQAGSPAPPDPVGVGRRQRPPRAAGTTRGSHTSELECLQRAQAAFEGRDFRGALAALAAHARLFPDGWLAEEREALRARSLAGAGWTDEARRAADAFGERFPRSVLLPRLGDTMGAAD